MRNLIYIIDVSGKVARYDDELYSAMIRFKQLDTIIDLKYSGHGLLDLIPQKLYSSGHPFKRLVKALEGLINYFYLLVLFTVKRPLIVHFQWLPYLEFCSVERVFLFLTHMFSPKTKFVLTIHNVYPHNMKGEKKNNYAKRFCKLSNLINGYIVHTETTQKVVSREFNIVLEKIFVCYHGVFVPSYVSHNVKTNNGKKRILQFGGQSYYKGTDIFVEALSMLPKDYSLKIEPHIVGGINPEFLERLKSKDKSEIIKWKPYYLKDEDLYQEIEESDLIVLPYREISQSGVLMLSIHFGKPLLVSNLPTFIETLRGDYNDDNSNFYFENGSPQSMCSMLKKHIDNLIDVDSMKKQISHLAQLYSWANSAQMTYSVYKSITS